MNKEGKEYKRQRRRERERDVQRYKNWDREIERRLSS